MATEQTFNDFFAGQRMTRIAAASAVQGGVPRDLPDDLFKVGPTKPFDDKVQFNSITWNRTGATIVHRGSPPRNIDLGKNDWKFATIMNMREEMGVDFQFLTALLSTYEPIRENAQMELNNRMIMFNQRFETTRTQMVNSLFANGAIWVGSDGQILSSSSGAVITMDPGIPTGNKLTKAGAGSTYNIGDWSVASTDVQLALRKIQQYNVQQNNFVLKNILYGQQIPSYLSANTALAPYLARNPGFRDYLIAQNEIPNGFLGYNWKPVRLSYLAKAGASKTETISQTFADNFVGIYPDVSSSWYEFIEGGTQVPVGIAGATQIQPDATLQQMLGAFKIAYGKYAYGVIQSHPVVGQSMVQGDCCGPVLKNPNVYYFGTVS